MTVPVLSRLSAAVLAGMPFLFTGVAAAGPANGKAETAPAKPAAPVYQEGYDPAKEQREGIGILPEAAWGEAVNGLRAALTGPDKIRFNEKAEFQLVLRNVSDAVVRVAVPENNFALHSGLEGKEANWGHTPFYNDRVTRWNLQPGQQTVVRAARVICTEKGDLYPRGAFSEMTAGRYFLTLGCGPGRGTEVTGANGKRTVIPPPPGEWSGWLRAGSHPFELLPEKVPLEITPPPELPSPSARGLAPSLEYPPALRTGVYVSQLELTHSVWLLPHPREDLYWLQDCHRYVRNVFWGPFTSEQLQQAGLVTLLEKQSLALGPDSDDVVSVPSRIQALLMREGPLAAVGLRMVPLLVRRAGWRKGPYDIAKTIRERRPSLLRAGLEKEMRAALDHLTKSEPALPPAKAFTVIASTDQPKGLPETAWGPEDEGLRAAALMPAVWHDGEPAEVRLFIRNVSDRPVFLTLSERSGFDYPAAIDAQGKPAKVNYAVNFSPAIISMLRQEVDPGQSVPVVLKKIQLMPGAICEATSPGTIKWLSPEREKDKSAPPAGTFATLSTADGEATVTWQFHSTNGTEWNKDRKQRLWPAKGGWTGVLHTGPVKVKLKRK